MNNKKILSAVCASCLAVFLAMGLNGCSNASADKSEATETAKAETQKETGIEETNSKETEIAKTKLLEKTDVFAKQTSVDEGLAKELENGYSFEEPNVIIDPYGASPLTAVVIFNTEEAVGGTICVKGKSEENDMKGSIAVSKNHMVPVYGLYNGETTQVELTLDDGRTKSLEITAEKIEFNMGKIEIDMKDDTAYDYSELTFMCSLGGIIYAVDGAGDVRWYYSGGNVLGAHRLVNGHLMMPAAYTLSGIYYQSGLQEIDLNGKIYKEYAVPGGVHHDFQEMSNGNLLLAGNSPDLSSVEDHIVEIDRETGEVVWELDMRDLLDTEAGRSASLELDGSEELDWFHNNGLWYDEESDLILLSARHVDAVIAVKKSDKSLVWILGDPAGWELDEKYFFKPVGAEFEWQYAQHQVTMLDNGDIMMFDNGTAKVKAADVKKRVAGDDIYSRAVIYRIDADNMTVEQIFEYGKERGPEWYSDWVSGVISLDGTQNNLWITAGANLYSQEENSYDFGNTGMMVPGLVKTSHIDQITDGKLVFEMKVSGADRASLTYRSLRLPMYIENGGTDITVKGELVGNLGEKLTTDTDVSFEDVQELDESGWEFILDSSKMTLKGTYKTKLAADALLDGYLILKNGREQKTYALTQYGTEGDEGTNVAVNGWVSPVGLEGNTYEIYLVLDGVTYKTEYSVEL